MCFSPFPLCSLSVVSVLRAPVPLEANRVTAPTFCALGRETDRASEDKRRSKMEHSQSVSIRSRRALLSYPQEWWQTVRLAGMRGAICDLLWRNLLGDQIEMDIGVRMAESVGTEWKVRDERWASEIGGSQMPRRASCPSRHPSPMLELEPK